MPGVELSESDHSPRSSGTAFLVVCHAHSSSRAHCFKISQWHRWFPRIWQGRGRTDAIAATPAAFPLYLRLRTRSSYAVLLLVKAVVGFQLRSIYILISLHASITTTPPQHQPPHSPDKAHSASNSAHPSYANSRQT